MVQASSSAEREVNPFFMNLKMMWRLVSLAAMMSCQERTGPPWKDCYILSTVTGSFGGFLFLGAVLTFAFIWLAADSMSPVLPTADLASF
jgi:hypothetical protein